jgi:hypothetical protein
MQESQRIENRVRRLPEQFQQRRKRRLRGSRTFRMTAHPIDDDQQDGVLGRRNRDPVLIFVAMADQAHVRGLDLQ